MVTSSFSVRLCENERQAAAVFAAFFFVVEYTIRYSTAGDLVRAFFSKRNKSLKAKDLDAIVSGFAVRFACNLHNTHQCLLGMRVLLSPLSKDMFSGTSYDSNLLVSITTGFFLYDFLISVRDVKTEGLPFVAHGGICLGVYSFGLVTGLMHWFGAGFVLW